MSFSDIAVDAPAEGVVRVAIDRPEVRNAYRTVTCVELDQAVRDFVADETARVLILTGTGGAFCAGGDLSSETEVDEGHTRQLGHGAVMREGMHRVIRSLDLCDKPTIAVIDGPAVSGGLALALMCDFRIGSDRARLGDVAGSVGLLPDEGGAWLFPRAMGADAARRMSLLHEIYDASRARELGLLTEVAGDGDLETVAMDLARTLAVKAPLAARMTKRLMREGATSSLDESLRRAEMAVQIVNESDDVQEGVDAFLTKRTPRFQGK